MLDMNSHLEKVERGLAYLLLNEENNYEISDSNFLEDYIEPDFNEEIVMPLGVLSDEQAKSELERFGIACNIEIESHQIDNELESHKSDEKQDARPDNIITFSDINHGRGNKSETPESIRKFVASEALCGADPNVLSKEFNIF